jgi:hypothetical protein
MPSPAGIRRLLRCALVTACVAGALAVAGPVAAASPVAATPGAAPTASAATPGRSALIAFLPGESNPPPGVQPPSVLSLLDGHPELALGMVSATQSGYSPQQALLDLTAGTRTSRGTYQPHDPPDLSLLPAGAGGHPGLIVNWLAAVARAETAPADIVPGLLASSIPGGAAYAGIAGDPNIEAVAAAQRDGSVRAVSLGAPATVAQRARALARAHRLVVARLPKGLAGDAQLDALLAHRPRGELLIAIEAPPQQTAPQLLPTGIAGLRAARSFTSATTHIDGVAAGIDLLPTILQHLGIAVPSQVRGEPIHTAGTRDAAALQRLNDRLSVIIARRNPALETFLFGWLAVLLVAGIARDRAGVRFAMRAGGLALLWLPTMLLVAGALQPSRQAELFLIAIGSFVLAFATDRLLAWPRGPAVPALTGLMLYAADLVNHSHFLLRSLLGPNPRSGSRFYGIGNELEIALTVLLLIAVAATLPRRQRTRGGALAFALAGVAWAAIVGAGRLGADVGGVFTIAAGAGVATLLMLPGGVTRRAVAVAVLAPAAGLGALALLDVTTGGNGHFVRNVLHGSSGDLLNTLQRRYELAWSIVSSGTAPLLTLLCGLAVAYALVHRRRVYAAIEGDPVWRACLWGGLAASVAGSLFNDSGPILLFIGIVALLFLTTYLRGGPAAPAAPPAGGDAARAARAEGVAPGPSAPTSIPAPAAASRP